MIEVLIAMSLCNITISQLLTCGAKYNIGQQVGKGGQAQLVEATNIQDSTKVVIKIFITDASFLYELDVVQKIMKAHWAFNGLNEWRCLPKMFGECLYENRKAMVMERLDKDISVVVEGGGFTFSDNVVYAKQILQCVAELHQLGYVHQDLKPENIMLAYDGTLKIIDFGMTALSGEECSRDYVIGTPRFVAPESVNPPDDGTPLIRSNKTDVWSAGQILFQMFTLEPLIQNAVIVPILRCIRLARAPLFIITYFIHKCIFDTGSDLSKSEEKMFHTYESALLSCCLFSLTLDPSRRTYSHCDSKHWLVDEYQSNLQWNDNMWKSSGVSDDDRGSLNRLLYGLLIFDPQKRDTVNVALTNPLFTKENTAVCTDKDSIRDQRETKH